MNNGNGSSDNAVIDPQTMRGRDWPCLRQFCVFMENRVGNLHLLLREIEKYDLRVVALSIADSVDCAIARLVLNNYERGLESLELSGLSFIENEIVGVELPDDPQPYLKICLSLLQAEINIHYTYPLLLRRKGRGAIALYVDNVDSVLSILNENGHKIITEQDLLDDDEYF